MNYFEGCIGENDGRIRVFELFDKVSREEFDNVVIPQFAEILPTLLKNDAIRFENCMTSI